MREILLRGKRTDNHEWVYGSLIDKDYILNYIDLAESWDACTSDHKVTCRAFEVLPETVGQYTTQNDRSGVKIWEGDILSGHSDGNVVVKWAEDCWECIFSDEANITLSELVRWFGNNATVIGNIYDHPELLQP